MCGRYTITITWEELLLRYYIDGESVSPFHVPRYNVSPGTMIPAIIAHEKVNRMGLLKWGLIPSWAKDEKMGYTMLNARAETLTEKSAFRVPFQCKRCLIPADGFYEWKKSANGKQPMRIVMKNQSIFSMAGLYDTWINPEGIKVSSCTIITTAPNELMLDIHDRMPAILRKEDEVEWLNSGAKVEQLQCLLKPYATDEMYAYPVSTAVGNVNNQGAELVENMK